MNSFSLRLTFGLCLILLGSLINHHTAIAQIIPDNSLGSESSQTRPDTIKNTLSDVIEGGATRGSNLFHSFREFNVNEGRGAYFANPDVIQNIFSRVTGGNISQILGTLGVLGNANLFLINPNGIIFGPNARLDLRGAFIGATADSVVFDNNFEFSATNPNAPPLLTVNIPLGLRFRETSADITSTASLVTPSHLTLKAGNLNLSGTLAAGGDLSLEALNTLTIRDSVISPFIAVSGGNLLLQGNQSIDIYALNHPQSGIISGGDLVLRSTIAVSGDAHYWSGGSFRIEKLDGTLGGLVSLYDPVIRASGDVYLDSYTGTSLHILAGGLVYIPGTILITGIDETGDTLAETVTLSDGSTINIDGSLEPTLDIRAGTTAVGSPFFDTGTPTSADIILGSIEIYNAVDGTGGKVFLTNQDQPNLSLNTLYGGITIGSVEAKDVYSGGSVIIDARSDINLTGQVNASALNVFTTNVLSYLGNGGDVTLISDGNILSESSILAQGLLGGNVTLTSTADVLLDNGLEINVRGGGGGNITINAQNVGLLNASQLRTGIATGLGTPDAQAGDITINATGIVAITNSSSISNALLPASIGNAGDIKIATGSLYLNDGGQIFSRIFGKGDAGAIKITANDTILLTGVNSQGFISGIYNRVESEAEGGSGGIEIATGSLSLTDGAYIQGSTYGSGNAGNISINTKLLEGNGQFIIGSETSGQGNAGQVVVNATERISLTGGIQIGIISIVRKDATGNGGDIIINTPVLSLSNFAQLATTTLGQGNAGNITIHATESISLSQNSILQAMTVGQGNAGKITIDAQEAIFSLDGSGTGITNSIGAVLGLIGSGQGGDINITAKSLNLTNGAIIMATTFGKAGVNGLANAGNIFIKVADVVYLKDRSLVLSQTSGEGNAGRIEINTGSLELVDGASIDNSTLGKGNAGDIKITARDTISLAGESSQGISSTILSQVEIHPTKGNAAEGNAGGIEILTGSLYLSDGATVNASTNGKGNAGNILIKGANSITASGGSQISTVTSSQGNAGSVIINSPNAVITFDGVAAINGALSPSGIVTVVKPVEGLTEVRQGGDINVTAHTLTLTNSAQINAQTSGLGNAGNVTINIQDEITLNGDFSGILTQVAQDAIGKGGNINLTADSLSLSNGAQIASDTFGVGDAGNINLEVRGQITLKDFVTFSDDNIVFPVQSSIATGVQGGIGNAGAITIQAQSLSLDNYSLITTATLGRGNAADISIQVDDFLNLTNLSSIESIVGAGAIGNSGNIDLKARSLTLTNGSQIATLLTRESSALNLPGGFGKAGNININISDFVNISGVSQVQLPIEPRLFPTEGFSSGLLASSERGASGDGGRITLTTNALYLADGAVINTLSANFGKAGDITINANTFSATGGGQVIAITKNSGNAGTITLNIQDNLLLSGSDPTFTERLARFGEDIVNNQGAESGLFAQTQDQGIAGSININAPVFNIADSAVVSARTSGSGKGGNIIVNAPILTTLGEKSQLNVETSGAGQAGNIEITSNTVTIGKDAQISATATRDASNTSGGGSININASNLNIAGELGIFAETQGIAPAGTLTLNPNPTNPNLNIRFIEQGKISASTSASGNGGDINISAPNNIDISGNGTIAVEASGSGNAGTINLNTNQLNLSSGVTVTASTSKTGTGNAGNINLNATQINLEQATVTAFTNGGGNAGSIFIPNAQTITLDNSTISTEIQENGVATEPSNITIQTQQLTLDNHSQITATTSGDGNAGTITITADSLRLTNRSNIQTNTTSSGIAGDLVFNLTDELTLDNSTLEASTDPNSTGNGGSIRIDPTTVNLNNNARISVNSQGVGDGGNLSLEARNLSLRNNSAISATTASGEGGNITLNVLDTVTQRNNSPISATASGTGNGGNITLNTRFLVGNENSNITANAFQGRGGNINITADGIFRGSNSPITASSQLGVDGVVQTNTPEVDPSRGLLNLPQNPVDPNALIAQNACRRGGQSEFTVTGRGGLPNTPEQVQRSNEVEVGLVEVTEQTATSKPKKETQAIRKIIPAQGWQRNDKGEMVLVAYPTTDNAHRQTSITDTCTSN